MNRLIIRLNTKLNHKIEKLRVLRRLKHKHLRETNQGLKDYLDVCAINNVTPIISIVNMLNVNPMKQLIEEIADIEEDLKFYVWLRGLIE